MRTDTRNATLATAVFVLLVAVAAWAFGQGYDLVYLSCALCGAPSFLIAGEGWSTRGANIATERRRAMAAHPAGKGRFA